MKLSKRFHHNGSPRVPMTDAWSSGTHASYGNGQKTVTITLERPMQAKQFQDTHDTERLRLEMTSDEARKTAERLLWAADEADKLEQRSGE